MLFVPSAVARMRIRTKRSLVQMHPVSPPRFVNNFLFPRTYLFDMVSFLGRICVNKNFAWFPVLSLFPLIYMFRGVYINMQRSGLWMYREVVCAYRAREQKQTQYIQWPSAVQKIWFTAPNFSAAVSMEISFLRRFLFIYFAQLGLYRAVCGNRAATRALAAYKLWETI